jgi:hypothetical protein
MDPAIVRGAVIGAVVGVGVVVATTAAKTQKYKKMIKTVTGPVEYSAMYHYASYKRYNNGFKYFDSYGALYVIGDMVYYKANETDAPLSFNMKECSVQMEKDWRWLKWFSIITPAGEKHYFNSSKMGAFKNNSDETLKGFEIIKSKTT